MTLSLIRPDDWHVHLRDGATLRAVVADTARQFARAVVMPNLSPPITTVAAAQAYRDRILAAVPAGCDFTPLLTLYLTEATSADDIAAAAASDFVVALKLYPAGATTNSAAGIHDFSRLDDILAAMTAAGLPLLVHGETTDPDTDVFDREAVFVARTLAPLHARHPELKLVLEHITTREGLAFVRQGGPGIAGTITAHHLLWNRNALFAGGLNPHAYCLPVLKREEHRAALLAAATGGEPCFFLGTDSAPHEHRAKEAACGCAGIYTAATALELYATAFERAGHLDRLEGFASLFGPRFYGLPVATKTVSLSRTTWRVPREIPLAEGQHVVPMWAGQELGWQFNDQ